MNTTQSSFATRFKVGIFTLAAFILIVVVTLAINDKPYWWRPCQLVQISVEDATGLKTKSSIRSLGIEIGYLKSVNLSETHVILGICITAPVEVLPTTKAYLRSEGFLGDKFVELKPVKYLEGSHLDSDKPDREKGSREGEEAPRFLQTGKLESWLNRVRLEFVVFREALAEEENPPKEGKRETKGGREIPVSGESQDVQHLVGRVDDLVSQMTGLADNLKQAINPEDLRRTMKQLNQTLENASKTLSPDGGLNQTAQRTLAKLEDAIEQLRDQLTRVNKGEGSVGMLLNDPTYAEEIRQAIRNINHLLNKVSDVKFVVNLGGELMTGYNGGRGWFNLAIWPNKERYYLLGISSDSRGQISNMTVVTTAGGITTTTQTQTTNQTSLLFTGMLGKIFFDRFDGAVGVLYNDAAASLSIRLGPTGAEERIQLKNDVYVRNSASGINDRITLIAMPHPNVYLVGGIESFSSHNGQTPLIFGGGITFTDEDIKLLFALK